MLPRNHDRGWRKLASAFHTPTSTEDIISFTFPSRFTLERKADLAPPCMIFAMASIGAIYYDDELTAASLHRMSKANTIKYVQLSQLTIADKKLWVLQCLLLVMANGTKSGDFRTFQEAASLASLLIEIIGILNAESCPPTHQSQTEETLIFCDDGRSRLTLRQLCEQFARYTSIWVR
ncbi:hypothetical protein CBS147330_6830 [Penicillium roqueforti]|nr:hypothetical protein CBS147330_6830 [Penicillium roqueforti]KAI3281768.1 hypothetical protein DTO002I6_9679 [Penicillium roqueforti]